jgi:type II secretory pathway predicted ATPase ExeA
MMKGGAMLTGEIGCGKTMISKVYMDKLVEEGSEVILLTNPPLKPIELLQEILYQMGITDTTDSKAKLLQSLNKKIMSNMEQNQETIVIIDEAQILNEETCEEARLLLNLQSNNRFLLTLVLIGQTELRVKIKQMKQFDQRIAIRYHLKPFSLLDTAKYIMFRERKAGLEKNVFTKKSIKRIHEYSKGVPRTINSISDLCLLIAFNRQRDFVDSGIVNNIINELVQE